MISFSKLRKIKKKRILVLSAAGPRSGIQCVYIGAQTDSWEALSQAVVPYPQHIDDLIDSLLLDPSAMLSLEKTAWLDKRITALLLECAKNALAHAHSSHRQPHVVVVNKLCLFNGKCDENDSMQNWELSFGDAQVVAAALRAPVITDFIRQSVVSGGQGQLPLFPGNVKIAKNNEVISAYLNVGLISRLTVLDNQAMHTIIDSDVGPGTCLINMAAGDAGCENGFDRDGSVAAQGKVDNSCVETLIALPWFSLPIPKQGSIREFSAMYRHPCVTALSKIDRITTFTALTARSAFDFFKQQYRHALAPEIIHICGGGANNLTLMEYLSTYFDPLPVKTVEESQIEATMFFPLSLGLTVNDYLIGKIAPAQNSDLSSVGRWVFGQ